MAAWSVSEAAAGALEQTAAKLEELLQTKQAARQALSEAFEENESGLGAHSDQIRALIEEARKTDAEGSVQVRKLSRKVKFAAMTRRKHIENSGYQKSGAGTPAHETAAVLGRICDSNRRNRIVPHETGGSGRRAGSWTGDTFTPDDAFIPAKSNPGGMTFGQIRKDLKERYGIDFSGVPYHDGYADFSSVAVARVELSEVVEMRVEMDSGLIDSGNGGVNFEKLFAGREKNFDCADQIAARRQLRIKGLPEGYTSADLKAWRKKNKFSWDESYDNGYILVPGIVHDNIRHTGLVGVATHGAEMEAGHRSKLARRVKDTADPGNAAEEDAIISVEELMRKKSGETEP